MESYDLDRLFEVQDEPETPHPPPPRLLRPANDGPKSPVEPANEQLAVQDNLDDDQTPSLLGTLHSQLLGLEHLRTDLAQMASPLVRAEYYERMTLGMTPEEDQDDHTIMLLKEARNDLSAIRSKVDEMHGAMRHLINKESRRRVRKLNLLDLPDELLREICGCFGPYAEYGFPFFIRGYRSDIRRNINNIRLTCRRLYEASSHLLLSEARVLLDPAAVAELQAVSSHPFINKGIQRLYMDLDYYRADLAESPARFARYVLDGWARTLGFHATVVQPGRWDSAGMKLAQCSRRELARAMKKGGRLSREWQRFAENLEALEVGSAEMQAFINDSTHKSKAIAGLTRAHERFKERYRGQATLLGDDAFVNVVIDTLRKTPATKRLEVATDGRASHIFEKWSPWKDVPRKAFHELVDDPYCIARRFGIRRSQWAGNDTRGEDLPAKICLDIITRVFGNSDLSLDELSLTLPISSMWKHATEDRLRVLQEGTVRMREFEYSHDSEEDWPDDFDIFWDADLMQKTSDLLLACMGGPCLKRLLLRPPRLDPDEDEAPEFGMGRVLCRTPFANLESVSLYSFHIHLHELKRFLESLAHDKVYFNFDCVTLLSGTWAEAIDILRTKSGNGSSMDHLHGAECDELTEEERDAIFEGSISIKVAREQRLRENVEPLGRPAWERPEDIIFGVEEYIRMPMDYGGGGLENPFAVRARALDAMEADN